MHYVAPPASGYRDLRREHLGFWSHVRDVAMLGVLLRGSVVPRDFYFDKLCVALGHIAVLEEYGVDGWEMTR